MGLDGCCKFLKFIVFLINILITLVGVAVLVLAVLALISGNQQNSGRKEGSDVYFVICVMVIVMGSLLTIVGLIGCCGAALENQCLLGTFVFFMTVALALDVVAAILVEKNGLKVVETSKEIVQEIFSKIATDRNYAINADLYQQAVGCCGAESYADWTKASIPIPSSCCNEPDGCPSTSINTKKYQYKEGCLKVTSDITSSIIKKSPMVLATVGIFEALALITSLGLCCSIRKMGYY